MKLQERENCGENSRIAGGSADPAHAGSISDAEPDDRCRDYRCHLRDTDRARSLLACLASRLSRFRARFIALGLLFPRSKHIREGRGRDEELISRIVNEIVSTNKHVC